MVYESHRSYVDPEDIELGYEYCISIDPSNKHQYGRCWGHQRFDNFKEFWYSFFGKFLYSLKYKFFIEKSKRGRLHFHGIISFETESEADQFYDFLFRLQINEMATYSFGRMKDIIEDDEEEPKYPTWLAYCKKQQAYMKKNNYKAIIKSGEPMVLRKIDINHKDIKDYFKTGE